LLSTLIVPVPSAHAQVRIPPGFEVVQLTADAQQDRWVQINNCGEVVHTKLLPTGQGRAIFLHDNGKVTRITPDASYNYTPDINDAGTLVFSHVPAPGQVERIVRYRNGALEEITSGPIPDMFPRVNNHEHIAWDRWFGTGCWEAGAEIFFYDGESITQISANGFSNQSVCINDADQLAWTKYDFCPAAWQSAIFFHAPDPLTLLPIDTTIPQELPTGQIQGQIPTLNDLGQVAWCGSVGIEIWDGRHTRFLTYWGDNPSLNNRGDMYFIRWYEETETWQAWCYMDGMFYQLTGDPFWNTVGHINEYGEMAWEMGMGNGKEVRMLRRIRNGDTDFDLDVDVDDYAPWADCLTGPVETDRLCDCRFLDMQHDRDVDLADFALFQNAMGTVVTIDDHNCCAAHYDPGCTHPDIMACVCAALPECCQTTWTAACAAAVSNLSCGECP